MLTINQGWLSVLCFYAVFEKIFITILISLLLKLFYNFKLTSFWQFMFSRAHELNCVQKIKCFCAFLPLPFLRGLQYAAVNKSGYTSIFLSFFVSNCNR